MIDVEDLFRITGYLKGGCSPLGAKKALPVFIAALFVAVWTEGPQTMVDGFSVGFVLFRVLYVLAYITNQATLRSAVWSLAYLCAIGLFVSGFWAPA